MPNVFKGTGEFRPFQPNRDTRVRALSLDKKSLDSTNSAFVVPVEPMREGPTGDNLRIVHQILSEPAMRQRNDEERVEDYRREQEGFAREADNIAHKGLQEFIQGHGLTEEISAKEPVVTEAMPEYVNFRPPDRPLVPPVQIVKELSSQIRDENRGAGIVQTVDTSTMTTGLDPRFAIRPSTGLGNTSIQTPKPGLIERLRGRLNRP